jgi:Resolvase, N terminal domain
MPPCDTGRTCHRLTWLYHLEEQQLLRRGSPTISEGFWRIMWSSEILAWWAGPHFAISRASINVPVPTRREGFWHKEKGPPIRIGYAGVSTPDQRFTLQRDVLEQNGCTKVFQETASGAKTTRPALTGLR